MPCERVSVSDARSNLSELVSRVAFGRERVVLVRHGKPLAVLIGFDELGQMNPGLAVVDAGDLEEVGPPSGTLARSGT